MISIIRRIAYGLIVYICCSNVYGSDTKDVGFNREEKREIDEALLECPTAYPRFDMDSKRQAFYVQKDCHLPKLVELSQNDNFEAKYQLIMLIDTLAMYNKIDNVISKEQLSTLLEQKQHWREDVLKMQPTTVYEEWVAHAVKNIYL